MLTTSRRGVAKFTNVAENAHTVAILDIGLDDFTNECLLVGRFLARKLVIHAATKEVHYDAVTDASNFGSTTC
jgi:hypothetical protein